MLLAVGFALPLIADKNFRNKGLLRNNNNSVKSLDNNLCLISSPALKDTFKYLKLLLA